MNSLTDEKIISMYKAGFSINRIWELYSIPQEIIRKVLARENVLVRKEDK